MVYHQATAEQQGGCANRRIRTCAPPDVTGIQTTAAGGLHAPSSEAVLRIIARCESGVRP